MRTCNESITLYSRKNSDLKFWIWQTILKPILKNMHTPATAKSLQSHFTNRAL